MQRQKQKRECPTEERFPLLRATLPEDVLGSGCQAGERVSPRQVASVGGARVDASLHLASPLWRPLMEESHIRLHSGTAAETHRSHLPPAAAAGHLRASDAH
jgi:hypothetical protein